MQVTPDGKEGHVESDVAHGGVRLKDGDHSQLHEDQEHGMLPATRTRRTFPAQHTPQRHEDALLSLKDSLEFDGQRDGVKEDVDLEDAEEEQAEVFKHLCEEIPEEADVRRQVWNRETEGNEKARVTLQQLHGVLL